ncbi:MAG TPA: sulfatase-like hydrolase/transferase [Gemmatimonadales bacterium]
MTASRIALLGLWFSLLTGCAELVVRGIEHFALHRYIYLSRQIIWMTPAADVLLFLPFVLAGILLLRMAPAVVTVRGVTVLLGLVAAMSLLALQPWMAWWAMLPLAVGIAISAGRAAVAWPDRVRRFQQRSAVAMGTAIGMLAIAVGVTSAMAERRHLSAAPSAPAGAPNVLLIVWDAVRASDLSLYGYPRPTSPNLEALAREGTTFDRAMSTGPYTLPGHAGLFTARWPHEMRASWLIPMEAGFPTLAEVLGRRGYRTGAFAANHVYVTWEQGLMRGFSRAQDYTLSPGELLRSSALLKWLMGFDRVRSLLGWYDIPGRRPASDIRRSFLRWLDEDSGRPFFAFLNVFDAHDPYLPPAPFDSLFAAPGFADARGRRAARALAVADAYRLDPGQVAVLHGLYDGAIASIDRDLGTLLADLQARGVAQNTLIILCSDHGEEFGEHRSFGHGADLYEPVVHVPLVLVMPGRIPAGRRVGAVVSLRDLPATVTDLLGRGADSAAFAGRSLSRFWQPQGDSAGDTVLTEVDKLPRGVRAWLPVNRGNVRSIIAWPYQLISTAGQLELYNLAQDSGERHDLARLPEQQGQRDALLAALQRRRRDAVPSKR